MSIPLTGTLKEIYHYRHMLFALVKRNLKGKYNNSALGFLWHFITPAVSVALFYMVFGALKINPMENYWAYLCVGMFAFTFLNTNIIGGASCIVSNGGMIKKMHFPMEIIVLSQVLLSLVIFVISYSIVIILMLLSGIQMTMGTVWLVPLNLLVMLIFTTGFTMLISSISTYIRDLEFTIVAFARVLFWVTPIFYTIDSATGILGKIIWLNPLTYYVVIMQDALYFGVIPENSILTTAVVMAFTVALIGWAVFTKLKRGFAERI